MNTKSYQAQPPSTAASFSTIQTLRLAVMLAVMAGFSVAHAGVFVKTNNVDALNLATSWTNNAVPTAADIAQWDSTVSDVNNTTNTLGANLSLAGVKVLNPVANIVVVTNGGGNVLTVGASGIDLSAATADLTFSNNVSLLAANGQTWKVGSSRLLTLAGTLTRASTGNSATVNFDTSLGGTINIASGTASALILSGNCPFATLNLADYAALDISRNVVPAVTFYGDYSLGGNLSGTYASPILNITGTTTGATQAWRNSNALTVNNGVRFNVANSQNTRWTVDTSSSGRLLTTGAILIGPGVGAQNVEFNGSGGVRANGSGQDLVLHQNNTAGDLIFNTTINGNGTASLVKTGLGRVILNNTVFSTGITRIEAGTLLMNGTTTASGAATVNNGATLGGSGAAAAVTVATGGRLAPGNVGVGSLLVNGTLTLNAGAYLDCYAPSVPITNTTALVVVTNNSFLTVNGTVNVNIVSGKPAVGQYPLIRWTNSIPAPTFANFVLAGMPLQTTGYLSNNATAFTIDLVITNIAEPLSWATSSGTWNTNGGSIWKDPQGNSTAYQEAYGVGDSVLFQDALSGGSPLTVTLNSTLFPASTTVSNSTKTYTISGTGSVGGFGSFTKAGAGTLTLATENSFSGGLALNGGMVVFSALTNLGSGSISFGGGTLQYNGNSDDISVRTVTLNAGGGTIDTAGNTVNFANSVGNNGAGGLTKAGAGTLTLNGTNRYTGNTIVANGTLALGGFISNSPAIIVNSGAILDATSPGLTLRGTPVQTIAGAGTINGTVISSNGVITPGTNGVVGTLTFGNDLTVAGGTLVIDLSTNTAQRDLIEIGTHLFLAGGTVQLNVTGTLTNGVYKLIHYGGILGSGPGSSSSLLLSGYSQAGKILALSDTVNPNEIDLVVSTQGGASTVWKGNDPSLPSNWDIETTLNFTSNGIPVTFIQGDKPTFDDSSANPNVNLMAALQPGSVTVTANANNYVFSDGTGSGAGKLAGTGGIIKNGSSTLTIATANLNSGPTVINGGTVQVGVGGTLGDLGFGNVTNNGALVFYQGDDHSVSGVISGPGPLTQQGSGVVTLSADNSYSGPTIITAGSLQVGNGGATGSLGSSAITNDGTLIYNRSGSLTVGNIKAGPANQGALTFKGPAAVTLNSGNTYFNNTAVNGGVVKLAAAENIPSGATVPGSTGWLVLDGGATGAGVLDLNGFNQTVNALSGASGAFAGLITNSGASTTVTNVLTILGSASPTYFGSIADNATGAKTKVVVLGAGSYRPNGNNIYTGGTFVGGAATFVFANGASFPAGTSITMSNGTTFFMQQNGGGANTGLGILIPDSAQITMGSSASGNGYSGLITGNANTTVNIAGPVSYSAGGSVKQLQAMLGTVLIPSGADLRFSSTSGVNNGGDNTTFQVDGTLHFRNAGAVSLGALTGTGTIDAMTDGPSTGTDTFTIGAKGVNSTFSGTISDNVGGNKINALVKTGVGTLTLDGTLSYGGTTTVNNGVLAIASGSNPNTSLDSSPSLILQSNAVINVSARADGTLNLGNTNVQTLSGIGTVNGNLVTSSSLPSTLIPGTSGTAGTLTVTGNATLQMCTNAMDLSSVNTTGNGVNDLLAVGGNLTLAGTVVIRPNFLTGGVTFGQPYTLITYTGTLTGDTNNLALELGAYGHLTYAFSTNTPGAITLTFLGASSLVWRGDSTNSWQVGTVTNWFDGVSSNYYGQYDTVKFDDSASNFNAVVVGTVMPNGITVNADSNYVFSGSGKLSGSTSLIKTGIGTLTLTNSGVNDFSGATVVSNGVIYLRNTSTLSAFSSLDIKSAGLVKVGGFAANVGGLSGSGAIDNNGAAASVLTVGSQGSGVWSGSISNSGAGGINLILNNTNNFTVSGVNKFNSATASEINNGTATMTITNLGAITGAGEFWVGSRLSSTGKVTVAGGSLVVSNWLVIGRGFTNANGTLIVNSGTLQKAGANNIVVGSLGATGNLTVNGGQVLNNGMLWVGEAPGANAVVNLNGGLLQATQVRTNINGGVPDSSIVNFNGGTLQASAASGNFIAVGAANVQNGGLILDDGGFVLSVGQPLLAAGTGGLVKKGAGTVYLDAVNTYTGSTVVSNGTLAGIGTIAGPVTVTSTGNLGAGNAAAVGKLTVNNTLTLQGNATLRISKNGSVLTNDQVAGISTVNYSGSLTITTNGPTAFAAGDSFPLFSATTHGGSFTSIVGSPGAGLGYTFVNGVLTVVTTVATNPTNITVSVSGSTLTLSWPTDHIGWTLQAQTNTASIGLGTNWVNVPTVGNSYSTTIDPTKPTVFYRMKY